MKKIIYILLFLPFSIQAQNLPKFGIDSLLEIGAWNLNWFGDTAYGPTDEITQFKNVLNVLKTASVDVWSLEEVSDNKTYLDLMAQLSDYESCISTFYQTQKMAILWKKSLFEKIKEEQILTSYSNDFAGRYPLMATLRYKQGNHDTIYVISLHMKANTGTTTQKSDSYQRRKNAGNDLKIYLETVLQNKKYVVIGDWNDKLDVTIFDGVSPSPYKPLLDANYFFETKLLADKGRKTYYTGSVIDHIMVSDSLRKYYIDSSIKVFDNASSYISDFSYSTSDHYPLFGYYTFFNSTPIDTSHSSIHEFNYNKINIFPNPSKGIIHIQNPLSKNIDYKIYNTSAQLISIGIINSNENKRIDLSVYENGLYFIQLKSEDGWVENKKLMLVD